MEMQDFSIHFENVGYQWIVFPSHDGKAYVAEYGYQLVANDGENLLGVHIRTIGDLVDLHQDGATRDRLLNRILEKEFVGITARLIRVLVSVRGVTNEYFFSAQELRAHGTSGRLSTLCTGF